MKKFFIILCFSLAITNSAFPNEKINSINDTIKKLTELVNVYTLTKDYRLVFAQTNLEVNYAIKNEINKESSDLSDYIINGRFFIPSH